jgi:hypothetical protein
MYKNINVEAEHNELILENSNGDKVIIPANKRDWVKQKLSEGCDGCIDSLVETLPVAADYAQDGSLYSEYLNTDPPTKKPTQRPLDPNPDGSLPSYFKGSDTNPIQLDEAVVTAEAPEWLKYREEYVKNNPFNIDEYVENRYNTPIGREAIKKIDGESWRKELRQEGLEKRYNSAMDYAGEQLVKNKPQGELSRAEWLNQMNDKEEEIIKRNPKYQSSLWADTKRGLTSLMEQNPLQTFQNILNSSDYTNREKQEMLKNYADHPIMSKLGDAAKILTPLTIPSKMVQSAYKDDYSFKDALKGKKNNAGIVEDIVTDPLNLVGVGLMGKLSKADKVIDAAKVGSKVLGKTDDIVNPIASSVDDVGKGLTQQQAVQYRAERMLSQENKWVGQNNTELRDKFKNAPQNHNPASDYPAEKLGTNKGTTTEVSKDALLSEPNKARIAAHETGHYYRNRATEANEWNSFFDFSKLEKHKTRTYLRGKPTAVEPGYVNSLPEIQGFKVGKDGVPHGDEIRERAAQLKDYIAQKNNIPLNKDFKITESQLNDAIKNYVKDTGLDNNMTQMLSSLKDKKGFLKAMNKYALSITGIGAGTVLQNEQNKSEK